MIYRDNLHAYIGRGWHRILPLPPGAKHPPPTGWTGANAPEPGPVELEAWSRTNGDGNIALRMPDDVIGIDVDDYGTKEGWQTLHAAVGQSGLLPATWSSTARGAETASRILLYRVPSGTRFQGKLEIDGHSDVEIIQARHRYMVAPPSVHPNGSIYQWYGPDHLPRQVPPFVGDLPDLPEGWLEALSLDGPGATKQDLSEAEVVTFLAGLPCADDGPCFTLKARLAQAIRRLEDAGSRHDSAVVDSIAMLGLAIAGHRGGRTALINYGKAFVSILSGDRGEREAQAEYERMVAGAVKLRAREQIEPACACDEAFNQALAEEDDTDPNALPEEEIEREVRKQKIRLEAKRRIQAEESKERLAVPTFTDAKAFVWETENDVTWRIEGIIEHGATVGFFAAAKVGKSTVLGNLAHALLTGEPFLGQWPTTRVAGSVTLVDLEMSRSRLRTWIKKWGNGVPQLKVTSLRGQAGNFNVSDETHFERLAETLKAQNTEVLIVDPLGPLLRAIGVDENDPTAVGTVLDRFSALKEAADISEIIISHHAGHDHKDRPRGASTFMDWPDVMLLMRLKGKGSFSDDASLMTAPRVLSAYGRDVDVHSVDLVFDPNTGQVTTRSKTESDALAADVLLNAVVGIVRDSDGPISNRTLKARMRAQNLEFTDGQIPDLVSRAVEAGYITRERTAGGKLIGLSSFPR